MALRLRKVRKRPAKHRKRRPIYWLDIKCLLPLYNGDDYPPEILTRLDAIKADDPNTSLIVRMLTQDQKNQEDATEDQRRAEEWEELVHQLSRP